MSITGTLQMYGHLLDMGSEYSTYYTHCSVLVSYILVKTLLKICSDKILQSPLLHLKHVHAVKVHVT